MIRVSGKGSPPSEERVSFGAGSHILVCYNTTVYKSARRSCFAGAIRRRALYAYWIDEDLGSYWVGTKNVTNPDASTNVVKIQAEIDANKATESFWTALMNNDKRL